MRRLVLSVFCFMCISIFCKVGADISVEDRQKIKTILTGLDDSRMRLNSGVCRITGHSLRFTESLNNDIKIAFDYSKGLYRFDQGDDKRSLRTPDYYYEYLGQQMVTRQTPQNCSPSLDIKPFDIRTLGFFNFVGPYWESEYIKDERTELFEDRPVSLEEVNGVFAIVVERTPGILDFPPIIRKYWVDSRLGYSLIRAEYGGTDVIEISWEEVNRTWVPASFKLTSKQQQSAEWTIDWSIVNEPVPESYFDPTLLSDEVAVFASLELEDPIVLGKIGPGRELPGPLTTPEKRDYSLFRYTLMGLGIFLIILALGKKIYDWWKK